MSKIPRFVAVRRYLLILWLLAVGLLAAPSASAERGAALRAWPVAESQTRGFAVVVDDASAGTIAWSDPASAMVSDDSRALAVLSNLVETTHYLRGTGPSFSIPTGSTITGLKIELESQEPTAASDDILEMSVRLVKGGAPAGTAVTQYVAASASDRVLSFGGVSSLWGTTWSVAEANATDLGAAFWAVLSAGPDAMTNSHTVGVDAITMTVFYVPAPAYALHLPLVMR